MYETIPPQGFNLSGLLGLSAEDVQIIFSAASLILAIALLGVTLSQAISNHRMVSEMRRQRQEALYERRARVFRGVRRALGYVFTTARVQPDTIVGLLKAKSEARFLLGKDLCDYFDEIYKRCIEAHMLQGQLKELPIGPERTALVTKHHDAIGWILHGARRALLALPQGGGHLMSLIAAIYARKSTEQAGVAHQDTRGARPLGGQRGAG